MKINLFPRLSVVYILKIYQLVVSPILPPSCRHYPTCSEYSVQSVKRFGVFKGGILAIKRLLKCNPFFIGGYDPVPESYPDTKLNSEDKK